MFSLSAHNNRVLILFLLLVLLPATMAIPQANAFFGSTIRVISASLGVLSKKEIIKLSKLSDELQGTSKVGKELGKLNLSDDVLEDTFLRIAIHQEKLARETAEGMYTRLAGVPGFRTTLRKVIGNSDTKEIGHLNELKIADTAVKYRFKVLGIGETFSDGLKKAPTDIDILLEKGGKVFAIEAKNYAPTTKIPMDRFRADLDTLVAYKKKHGNHVVPVFTVINQPNEPRYLKMLKKEANKRGVQLIFGTPQAQMEQIKILSEIKIRRPLSRFWGELQSLVAKIKMLAKTL